MNMNEENMKANRVAVSREVLADLACQAASEIEGVVSCQQPTMETIASRVKREFMHKGVRLTEDKDGSLTIGLHLRVRYGASLPDMSAAVKKRVKEYLEGMTETEVSRVEITIEDVELPDIE